MLRPLSIGLSEGGTMLKALQRTLGPVLLAGLLMLPGLSVAQGKTKVHWYGQAAFRIDTPSGGVILIDPWLTVSTNPDKNSIAELDRVDYILVTHGHRDHVGDAVEIAKKTGAILVAPYGLQFNMKSMLGYPEKQATGATGGNVGGTIDLPKAGAKVTIVNAIHGSELTPPSIPAPAAGQPAAVTSGNPVGYVLQIKGGPTIYHTGDTDVYEDMKLIPSFFKVDLMLACIGGHFTMDPVRAALAVQWVKPRHVVPMHFGTYPILAGTPDQFRAALKKRKLDGRLIVMKPGEDRSF
jgi:L-ascorbate metabolism protein UlaG (beta-lactamase superfamily)